MEQDDYWEVFCKSGSVDAYLAWKSGGSRQDDGLKQSGRSACSRQKDGLKQSGREAGSQAGSRWSARQPNGLGQRDLAEDGTKAASFCCSAL